MVCSPLMPAAPEPPPGHLQPPDRAIASTPDRALAPAPEGLLASVPDGSLAPLSAADLARVSGIGIDIIFYDGHCGMCHRSVRWVVKRDPAGTRFRFAPLQGTTFQKLVPAFYRAALPDSMVLRTADGNLLLRSDVSIHILRRLGGPWIPLASMLHVVPRVLRDGAYDFIARIRRRLFARPTDTCPILPPDQRARFDD